MTTRAIFGTKDEESGGETDSEEEQRGQALDNIEDLSNSDSDYDNPPDLVVILENETLR